VEDLENLGKILERWVAQGIDYRSISSGSIQYHAQKTEGERREVDQIIQKYKGKNSVSPLVMRLKDYIETNQFQKACDVIDNIQSIEKENIPKLRIVGLPADVSDAVNADLDEIERCFQHACYRSAIILCGRVLEIALHRKYYDVHKKDILETQPGIGLGKLIAKLKEKAVVFDPGITEQIHLINNIRVHSVHKKQEVFSPSKEQTQAVILYTIDIVRKLIGRTEHL